MQYSLVNPPKIFARNASGRMVQIAGHAGDVGRFENIVVPDEKVIAHLRPAIGYLAKLKPQPFNYGTSSSYDKHNYGTERPTTPIKVNGIDDLPLFEKQSD